MRFEKLQDTVIRNLNDKVFMLNKASKKIEMVMDFYRDMMFEENICEMRTYAGYIAMFLSDAVAYTNQTYFSQGLKKQIEDLMKMESIPKDFILMYEAVIKANSTEQLKEYCYKMIKNTRDFLGSKSKNLIKDEKKANYKNLAKLYQEIISTWNKIYVCCDTGNAILAYISGTCLQYALDTAVEENGLNKFDLMSAYNSKHLNQFKDRAIKLQKEFVKMIEDNGVTIESYDNVEEFITRN
jgi:dGTP triphosphohydrolase